jgi:hypothetical protein
MSVGDEVDIAIACITRARYRRGLFADLRTRRLDEQIARRSTMRVCGRARMRRSSVESGSTSSETGAN